MTWPIQIRSKVSFFVVFDKFVFPSFGVHCILVMWKLPSLQNDMNLEQMTSFNTFRYIFWSTYIIAFICSIQIEIEIGLFLSFLRFLSIKAPMNCHHGPDKCGYQGSIVYLSCCALNCQWQDTLTLLLHVHINIIFGPWVYSIGS